ncbi:MAG: TerC family protein [Chloroflexi bacterium]|nr:TerC family protein [Chloroflexota bacterium]
MEVVLGIDNVVFIAILAGKLEVDQRQTARRLGLLAAMLMRIGLLFTITWVMGLTQPFFTVLGRPFSGRDLILLGGGLFLLAKATREIHERIEGPPVHAPATPVPGSLRATVVQIMVLDIVFSLDSVITAVGMARHIAIMVAAVMLAVAVMLIFADTISHFIERHPTLKILALSFLLLIGVMLVADGLGQHIDKGYIYFAMAFALGVETINLRVRQAAAKIGP